MRFIEIFEMHRNVLTGSTVTPIIFYRIFDSCVSHIEEFLLMST